MRIHRGLYCLADRYLKLKPDPFALAQRIYGPSYISLETALSYYQWIPEAVYSITSVCLDRSREFDTPLGHFVFTSVPQTTFYIEVARVERASGSFLLAAPLKALADYVYVHKENWTSASGAVQSLRVDENSLTAVGTEAIDPLEGNYASLRVKRFFKGLRKDLQR